ncbi:hypothetical protein K505DRAFT_337050 [Melanomma pulvis-pyrius CBS 109.77]|uniref:Uncharacterized protein n=1 Tax=Melanomma pulvis-pyrius CBS 109.77 TaxID=1314802 RepID=A0A6A6XCV7_9PLEO|nr:hypothetical protein K505DRAFT_337050 [Melanomma pulvis-pyrius CBS 109.77]
MASTILALIGMHGFRATLSALTSPHNDITITNAQSDSRSKYALIRSKRYVKSASGNRKQDVKYGRQGVYRLIRTGRDGHEREEPYNEEARPRIDVWRIVQDGALMEEGVVKERWTTRKELDPRLRQAVRRLREQESNSENESKEDEDENEEKYVNSDVNSAEEKNLKALNRKEIKPKRKKNPSSHDPHDHATERQRHRRASARNGTIHRASTHGYESVGSTTSVHESTSYISAQRHYPIPSREQIHSPPIHPITTSVISQPSRQKPRPPVEKSPFVQPTMTPEQSLDFIFGDAEPNVSINHPNGKGAGYTIRAVPPTVAKTLP